jgi:hypothetical protein
MIQGGSSLRLALETGESLGIFGYFVGQKLESDKAMEPGVFRLVDHTHPTAAQLLDNAVVRDGLADHGREMLGGIRGQVNESRGVGGISEGLLVKK